MLGLLLRAALCAQPVVLAPCGVSGVTVDAAPSADYFEALDQVVGADRTPRLNAWMPFGVAITNRTTQNIVAVAVRWVLDGGGDANPPILLKVHMFDQPRQQVAPGKTVIAIPVALLRPTRPPTSAPLPAASPEFLHAHRIEVALDGVVFASGEFSGPNTAKEFEAFAAEAAVPQHVASAVLAMKESGEKISTVVAWLDTNAKRSGDWNAQVSARTARQLLQDYKRGGEVLLYETAQRYAQMPGIRVYRKE